MTYWWWYTYLFSGVLLHLLKQIIAEVWYFFTFKFSSSLFLNFAFWLITDRFCMKLSFWRVLLFLVRNVAPCCMETILHHQTNRQLLLWGWCYALFFLYLYIPQVFASSPCIGPTISFSLSNDAWFFFWIHFFKIYIAKLFFKLSIRGKTHFKLIWTWILYWVVTRF